jgi:hypothetical protein
MVSCLLISLDLSKLQAICRILTVLNFAITTVGLSTVSPIPHTHTMRYRFDCLTASLIPHTHTSVVSDLTVALPETFPLLRALLNLLKESLGRSKLAANLMQAH